MADLSSNLLLSGRVGKPPARTIDDSIQPTRYERWYCRCCIANNYACYQQNELRMRQRLLWRESSSNSKPVAPCLSQQPFELLGPGGMNCWIPRKRGC